MSSTLEKIQKILLRQRKKVEQDLKAVEKEDPVLNSGLAESSEPGTDSWLADVHTRAVAVKMSLQKVLSNIQKALEKIRSGKYGRCEKCGKLIEPERLEVMPTATLCIKDSKNTSKK